MGTLHVPLESRAVSTLSITARQLAAIPGPCRLDLAVAVQIVAETPLPYTLRANSYIIQFSRLFCEI
jgi:hypothetical protein